MSKPHVYIYRICNLNSFFLTHFSITAFKPSNPTPIQLGHNDVNFFSAPIIFFISAIGPIVVKNRLH